MKMTSTKIQLIATVLLGAITIITAIANYKSQKEDQAQKDRIQELAEQTKKLSELNKNIGNNVHEITQKTQEVTKSTLDLSIENKKLISNVQGLSKKAELLIKKIDERTAKEVAENLETGELRLNFSPPLPVFPCASRCCVL